MIAPNFKFLAYLFLFIAIVVATVSWVSFNDKLLYSRHNPAISLENIQNKLINSLVLPSDYKQVPSFSLQASNGNAVTDNVFDGKWSMVFFGYTNCPDICPVTLSIAKEAIEQLAAKSVHQPQVLFVSVDPERDTANHLNNYLSYFDPNFIGITGDIEKLSTWVSSMGVMFKRNNEENKTSYSVDHSATILMIDPKKRIRGVLNAPLEVKNIVSDYQTIVNRLSDTSENT